jgi:hypothetical protein
LASGLDDAVNADGHLASGGVSWRVSKVMVWRSDFWHMRATRWPAQNSFIPSDWGELETNNRTKAMSLRNIRNTAACFASIAACHALAADTTFVFAKSGNESPVELGIGRTFGEDVALRASIGRANTRSDDHAVSGSDYQLAPPGGAMLNLQADWYPMVDLGLRLSGGLALRSNTRQTLKAKAVDGNYVINGQRYARSTVAGYASQMDVSRLGGYLGLGWDTARPGERGLHYRFDLGVQISRNGTSTVEVASGTASAGLAADLDAQRRHIDADLGGMRWRSAAAVGLSYSF